MTGNEFLRRLRALGKRTGLPVALDAARGKGSHQTVYFGSSYTILRNPKDKLKTGTLHAMSSQPGIKVTDLQESPWNDSSIRCASNGHPKVATLSPAATCRPW